MRRRRRLRRLARRPVASPAARRRSEIRAFRPGEGGRILDRERSPHRPPRDRAPRQRPAARDAAARAQAFLATEDRRFYEHNGLDWRGFLRAVVRQRAARSACAKGSARSPCRSRATPSSSSRYHGRSLRRKLIELRIIAAHRARADQGPDPRALPQRHLPRQRHERRRGGEPRPVRQARQRAHRRRGRHARRAAEGAVAYTPRRQPARALRAAATSCSA